MMKNLVHKLKCLEGQPVKIFTHDRRVHRGIEIEVCEDAVEIIDECGRLDLIQLFEIDAIELPQLELRHCHR